MNESFDDMVLFMVKLIIISIKNQALAIKSLMSAASYLKVSRPTIKISLSIMHSY